MKKFKRRVKFKVLPKILFVVSCFALVFAFAFSSHAFSYDPVSGNLISDNVLDSPQTFDIATLNNSSNPTQYSAYVNPNTSYTISFVKSRIADTIISNNSVYNFRTLFYRASSTSNSNISTQSGNIILLNNSYSVSYSFTTPSNCYYILVDFGNNNGDTNVNTRVTNAMIFESSKNLTSYEPYAVEWYNSTQYENYGNSKYSEGYNHGVSDTLDSLSNMEIGYLRSGVSLGVYDSTNTSPLYRGTLTDVSSSGTGVHLQWSIDSDPNVYYRLEFTFGNNYIFKNIKWTPNRFKPPVSLTYGVNEINHVNYDGHYYGFFDLDQNDVSGYNSFTLNFRMNATTWEGFTLYVDALNLNLADSQDLAESNFKSGYDVGYEKGYSEAYNLGYSDATANIKDANANYKTLIWTIASTPWESFKHIWSFDILGLNVANIVIGFIMVLVLIYLIKKIWR